MRYKLLFGMALLTNQPPVHTQEEAVRAAKKHLLATGAEFVLFVDRRTGFRYRVRQLGFSQLAMEGAQISGNQFSVTNLDSSNCGNSNSGNNCGGTTGNGSVGNVSNAQLTTALLKSPTSGANGTEFTVTSITQNRGPEIATGTVASIQLPPNVLVISGGTPDSNNKISWNLGTLDVGKSTSNEVVFIVTSPIPTNVSGVATGVAGSGAITSEPQTIVVSTTDDFHYTCKNSGNVTCGTLFDEGIDNLFLLAPGDLAVTLKRTTLFNQEVWMGCHVRETAADCPQISMGTLGIHGSGNTSVITATTPILYILSCFSYPQEEALPPEDAPFGSNIGRPAPGGSPANQSLYPTDGWTLTVVYPIIAEDIDINVIPVSSLDTESGELMLDCCTDCSGGLFTGSQIYKNISTSYLQGCASRPLDLSFYFKFDVDLYGTDPFGVNLLVQEPSNPDTWADMSIDLGVSPSTIAVGDTFEVTITITNNGPSSTTGVEYNLYFNSTADITLTGSFLSGYYNQPGSEFDPTNDVRNMDSGAFVTAIFTYIANSAGPLTLTAECLSNAFDPNSEDNYERAFINVASALHLMMI